jgi:lipoprotein-releasing system ATP-binding protein
MSDSVLELRSVCKSFSSASDDLVILENISLVVPVASNIAIVGESGCGKSTLLNIIGGLESPSSGSVVAGPYRVETLTEAEITEYRSRYLGFVFQFHYLLKDFTALENVMLPARMAGMKKSAARERARELLASVKLEHRMDHFPSQMSGGERQRAAVARSLVNSPLLVLADEPTGNLDPANAETVRELLFSMVAEHSTTLVLVTHDKAMASFADTCFRLDRTGLVSQ